MSFLINLYCAKLLQLCLTLCNHMDYSHQGPRPMQFSRQQYWSSWPFPPPGDLSNPGIEPMSPAAPALQANSVLWSHRVKICIRRLKYICPAPAPSHTPCILAGRGGLDSPLTPEAWAPETPLLLCDLAVTGHLPGVLCSFRPTCILSPYHIWPSSQAGPLVPSPTASSDL